MTSQEDNGSLMNQAQHIWSMLDDMANCDPAAYRHFIDKHLKEGKESLKPPEPHMCVKTTAQPNSDRIFLNICGWARIPIPKTNEDPIPVMGGKLYTQKDNDGPYRCVTVAFNPQVLEEFGIESTLIEEQRMLVNLALDYLMDQYKLKVSRSYVLLPVATRYKGDLDQLRKTILTGISSQEAKFEEEMSEIQKTFGPPGTEGSLLSQLSQISVNDCATDGRNKEQNEPVIKLLDCDTMPKKKGLIEEVSSEVVNVTEPEHTVITKESPRQLVVKIKLPGVSSVSDCHLDISEADLLLEVEGMYKLDLKFSEVCDEANASAKFSKKSCTLTVTLPARR